MLRTSVLAYWISKHVILKHFIIICKIHFSIYSNSWWKIPINPMKSCFCSVMHSKKKFREHKYNTFLIWSWFYYDAPLSDVTEISLTVQGVRISLECPLFFVYKFRLNILTFGQIFVKVRTHFAYSQDNSRKVQFTTDFQSNRMSVFKRI